MTTSKASHPKYNPFVEQPYQWEPSLVVDFDDAFEDAGHNIIEHIDRHTAALKPNAIKHREPSAGKAAKNIPPIRTSGLPSKRKKSPNMLS